MVRIAFYLLMGSAAGLTLGEALKPLPFEQKIRQATLLVKTSDGGSGSAVVIDDMHAVSAGHVCASQPLQLIDYKGNNVKHKKVEYEHGMEMDVCVITGDFKQHQKIPLGRNLRDKDKIVTITGFPQGLYGQRNGNYKTTRDTMVIGPMIMYALLDIFSGSCIPGDSGGAIITTEGTYGGLVIATNLGARECLVVPTETVSSFLKEKEKANAK